LQCVAVCYSALQCAVVCCSVVQFVLQCVAVRGRVRDVSKQKLVHTVTNYNQV